MRILLLLLVFIVISCSTDNSPPAYWPVNGTAIFRVKWAVPASDSLNILSKDHGKWILPVPGESTSQSSDFREPQSRRFSKYLGRVDQEVTHSTQQGVTEFYRFENKNVLFLGFTLPDSAKPLLMFDPPLIVLPNNVLNLERTFTSTSVMKTLNYTLGEFGTGDTTRLTLKKLDSGFIKDPDEPAGLFEMKITSDKTIAFGESGLTVPEAVILESKMLIGKNGTILEWEMKSKEKENPDSLNTEKEQMNERKFFIEITKTLR